MENIKEKVLAQKDEIINDLKTLVSYPSINNNNENNTPFGIANQQVLHKALQIAQNYGFKTVNLDDYCGYIEMGQGKEIIGVVCHLDVVPVSPTWSYDPFTLTQVENKLYGRGSTDDKGPAVCSLHALKILKEIEPTMNKRIRLILGCNEETGSECMAHYIKCEGHVDLGFTPDGNFPVIFGEKGMVSGIIQKQSTKIENCSGGTVSNAVANSAVFKLKSDCINQDKLDNYFKENNITYTYKDNTLTVKGVAAHASTPNLGVNAISYGIEGLYQANINDPFIDEYHKLIGTYYDGRNLGINFKDEYGPLTFNVGLISSDKDIITATIDIRFPVSSNKNDVLNKMKIHDSIKNLHGVDPLFFEPNHPMIKALCDAYYSITNDTENKPMVIGGGTYAKSMHNIVAFGCEFPNRDYHIHDDDEFTTVEELLLQTELYTQALINLLNL